MLLSLLGMFLALGMVILAVGVGGSAMRLRCGFVMFRRLVVFVFHGVSSLLAENVGSGAHGASPQHPQPGNGSGTNKSHEGNSIMLSLLWNFSVKCRVRSAKQLPASKQRNFLRDQHRGYGRS
jgi:hypothetical protein